MKPSVSLSGGNPNGIPDFCPANPWGREMPPPPRPYRSPFTYQVHVKDRRDRKEKPVGPRWEKKEFAEMLSLAIAEQISLGAERRWVDPHIVMVTE